MDEEPAEDEAHQSRVRLVRDADVVMPFADIDDWTVDTIDVVNFAFFKSMVDTDLNVVSVTWTGEV